MYRDKINEVYLLQTYTMTVPIWGERHETLGAIYKVTLIYTTDCSNPQMTRVVGTLMVYGDICSVWLVKCQKSLCSRKHGTWLQDRTTSLHRSTFWFREQKRKKKKEVENGIRQLSMIFFHFIFDLLHSNSFVKREQNIWNIRKSWRQLWLFARQLWLFASNCECLRTTFCSLTPNCGSCISFSTFQACQMSSIWFSKDRVFTVNKMAVYRSIWAISSRGQKVTHVAEIWGEITGGSWVIGNLVPVSSVDTWLFNNNNNILY